MIIINCWFDSKQNDNYLPWIFVIITLVVTIISVLSLAYTFKIDDVSHLSFVIHLADYWDGDVSLIRESVIAIGIIILFFIFLRSFYHYSNCELTIDQSGVRYKVKTLLKKRDDYIAINQIKNVKLGTYNNNKYREVLNPIRNCYFLVRLINESFVQFVISEDDLFLIKKHIGELNYPIEESIYDQRLAVNKNYHVTLTKNKYLYWFIVILILYIIYKLDHLFW